MIFFCNGNGDVFHVIPDRVYQGSAGANVVRLVGQFPSSAQVLVAYQLPQGEWTVPKFMTPVAQLEEVQAPNGGKFAVWETLIGASPQVSADGKIVKDEDGNTVYDLDYTITQDFGTVKLQFYVYSAARGMSVDGVFTNVGGQLLATASSSFIVEKGVPVVAPEFDTDDSKALLQQILAVLANTQELYENTAQALETVNETLKDHDNRIWQNGAAIASTNLEVSLQRKQIDKNTTAIDELHTSLSDTQDRVSVIAKTAEENSIRLTAAEIQISNNEAQIDKNTAAIETLQEVQSVMPSDTPPLMDGTAKAGTANTYARGDHVHPIDTGRLAVAEKGNPNGVATLDSSGKVPSEQLPSYVDDVIDFDGIVTGSDWQTQILGKPVGSLVFVDEASSPYNKKFVRNTNSTAGGLVSVEPVQDVIYVDTSDNSTYRWSGTTLASLSSGLKIGETTGTAYDGGKGAANAAQIDKNTAAIKTNTDGISSLKTQVSQLDGKVNTISTDIANTKTGLTNLTEKVNQGYVTVSSVVSSETDEFQITYASDLEFTLPLSGSDDISVDVNEKGTAVSVTLSAATRQKIVDTADAASKNSASITSLTSEVDENTKGLEAANATIAQNLADINSQGKKIAALETGSTTQAATLTNIQTTVADLSATVLDNKAAVSLATSNNDTDKLILEGRYVGVTVGEKRVDLSFASFDVADWGDGVRDNKKTHSYTDGQNVHEIKIVGNVSLGQGFDFSPLSIYIGIPTVNYIFDGQGSEWTTVGKLRFSKHVQRIGTQAIEARGLTITEIEFEYFDGITFAGIPINRVSVGRIIVDKASIDTAKQTFGSPYSSVVTARAYLSDLDSQSIDLSEYYQTVSSVTALSKGFKVTYSKDGESIALPLVGSDTIVETVDGNSIKYELATTWQNAINKSLKLPSAIDGVEEVVTLKPQNGSTTPVQSSVKLNTLLQKPSTPTEDSAVVITTAGSQTLKPLSDIGGKVYDHKITFNINKVLGNNNDISNYLVEIHVYDSSPTAKQQSWFIPYIKSNQCLGSITAVPVSGIDPYDSFAIGIFNTDNGINLYITLYGRRLGGTAWHAYSNIKDNIVNFTDTVTEL